MNVDGRFGEQVRRYAALLARIAVNIQPGQRFIIWKAPVDAAWFVRTLAEEAYKAGAVYVEVFWQDDRLELTRLTHTAAEVLEAQPQWQVEIMERAAAEGHAFLFFDCTCAGVFDHTPAATLARALALENEHLQRVWSFFIRNEVNWSIATVPTESWARKVYPDEPSVGRGLRRLWEDIFVVSRVQHEDFAERWHAHRKDLEKRCDVLNEQRFEALRFVGPGTDLRIGLPARHRWQHPGFQTTSGIPFIADIPIEEIFTLPDRDAVEGEVTSTGPLVVSGRTINEFTLRIEGGEVREVRAGDHDRELLERIIRSDAGAGRLGEVALVPQDSPVARLRRPYYNTLFDENSSCHLALGRAYRFCLDGAQGLSDEEFRAAGGNTSSIHIDFMVGSDNLDVWGVNADGSELQLLRSGRWQLPD